MGKAKTKKTSDNDAHEKVRPLDPVALTHALVEAYKRAAPLFDDYLAAYGKTLSNQNFDPMNVGKSYTEFLGKISEDPQKYWDMQVDFWQNWTHLWHESALKFLGESKARTIIEPDQGDRRFKAKEWQESALFDFIKQSYLLACKSVQKSINETQGLSDKDKRKLEFYAQLFANALSPTNFAMTNPEVIRETLQTGGENLVKGLENLIEDFERGHGALRISTTNYDAFKVGENIATTPGRVIYQNDLMQLIQYEPATDAVFKRPLLVVPPWINKYYILDLREDNSFVKWLTEQGHTVFVVSWVNPGAKLSQKRFEDYMSEGMIAALDQIEKATGEPDCNVIGYCLGGTLLSITLAYLEAQGKAGRIASATFLTTLIDFEHAGDMQLFLDDEQLEMLDRLMAKSGILESRQLQQTFSLLRANDLIWSFVVNNYLMGREPFPFDLLYWNDDSTNMPCAMHSFYLRSFYRDNLLAKSGGINMHSTPIDITSIKTPSYFLSTREDHIAPWLATFEGAKLPKGKTCFTLAASGHIAGVINAPAKNKYCYWTSDQAPQEPDQWLESAAQHEGSWWPHWQSWIKDYTGAKVPARKPAQGIEAAPGSYVKVKGS